MPLLTIRLGCDAETLAQARQEVYYAFLAAARAAGPAPARQWLQEVLHAVPCQLEPTAWVHAFVCEALAPRLQTLLDTQQPLLQEELERARRELHFLRLRCAGQQEALDPLTQARDAARAEARQLAGRVADLEAALERATQHQRAETTRWTQTCARLEAQVAALNRIVADQQLQLLGPDDPEYSP